MRKYAHIKKRRLFVFSLQLLHFAAKYVYAFLHMHFCVYLHQVHLSGIGTGGKHGQFVAGTFKRQYLS